MLSIRRKTPINQPINQSINQSIHQSRFLTCVKKTRCVYYQYAVTESVGRASFTVFGNGRVGYFRVEHLLAENSVSGGALARPCSTD